MITESWSAFLVTHKGTVRLKVNGVSVRDVKERLSINTGV